MIKISTQKIQEIVAKYGVEIYTKPKQFIAIISDYFPNDNFGALLKKVIEEGGKDIYKLKGLSGNELNINYTKTLDIISNKTFIAKDVILPALDLLCIGLGVSTSTIPKPAPPTPVVTPVAQPIPTPAPTQEQEPVAQPNPRQSPTPTPTPISDFTIEINMLVKYIGKGGVVTLPMSVTHIEDYAFSNSTKITELIMPSSITYIGDYAFSNCTNLARVTIPHNLNYIGDYAFNNCIKLSSITLPPYISNIGDYAFNNCNSLANEIKTTIKKINPDAL